MNKRNILFTLFALTLIGASSCGDKEDPGKEMDKKVKKALEQQGSASNTTVTQTNTVTATSTATSQ
jgi:hypothetical protein